MMHLINCCVLRSVMRYRENRNHLRHMCTILEPNTLVLSLLGCGVVWPIRGQFKFQSSIDDSNRWERTNPGTTRSCCHYFCAGYAHNTQRNLNIVKTDFHVLFEKKIQWETEAKECSTLHFYFSKFTVKNLHVENNRRMIEKSGAALAHSQFFTQSQHMCSATKCSMHFWKCAQLPGPILIDCNCHCNWIGC